MDYVYILKCIDGTMYCGYTNNLDKRLFLHNSGKASKYTRARLPVRYIFIRAFANKSKALSYEYKIKSKSKFIKNNIVEGNEKDFFIDRLDR